MNDDTTTSKAQEQADVKAREWWVNTYEQEGQRLNCSMRYDTKEEAEKNLGQDGKTIHVREVLLNLTSVRFRALR